MHENERTGGRRLLLAVGIAAVALAGVVGFFVGANGGARAGSIAVFGVASLPATPAAMATYGVALATAVLTALFGAVAVASRYEKVA